jgi:hypothetical protein
MTDERFLLFCLDPSCPWLEEMQSDKTLWTNRATCPKCDFYTDAVKVKHVSPREHA